MVRQAAERSEARLPARGRVRSTRNKEIMNSLLLSSREKDKELINLSQIFI
jgi:hypothetical protein